MNPIAFAARLLSGPAGQNNNGFRVLKREIKNLIIKCQKDTSRNGIDPDFVFSSRFKSKYLNGQVKHSNESTDTQQFRSSDIRMNVKHE